MISAELNGNRYLIKFKGRKPQFNEYINKIMSIPNRQWDIDKGCWSIPRESLSILQKKFKDIEYINNIIVQPSYNIDLDGIGDCLKLKPYVYQKEGIKFCIDNLNSLLVLPCGAGKSCLMIGVYQEALNRNIIKGPGLIVVKASLKVQWFKEVSKFSDLKPVIIQTPSDINLNIYGKIKRRQTKIKKLDAITDFQKIIEIEEEIRELKIEANELFASQFEGADLLILNYETVKDPEVKKQLHNLKLEFISADEIQYIKSRTAKRSQALTEFSYAKVKIGATATPVGKNPEDLFGIFKFINPVIFPSWKSFASLYIKYAGYGKIAGFKNLDKMKAKIASSIFIKTKEEISDQLPSLLVYQRYCELSFKQQEMNDKLMEDLEALHDKEFTLRSRCKSETEAKENEELRRVETEILALQTFAQELADAPELLETSTSEMSKKYACDGPNNKMEMLIDLITEIVESGEKVCVFSRFERMQSIFKREIQAIDKDIEIACVNGSMDSEERFKQIYDNFRDNENYKVLLGTDAIAEGINLSSCKYLIEYDLATSYAIQTQRHGRIERSDSIHDNVFVYQLIAQDSFDEIQQKIIEKKEGYDADLIKSLAKE